jgi:hypothetical protein
MNQSVVLNQNLHQCRLERVYEFVPNDLQIDTETCFKVQSFAEVSGLLETFEGIKGRLLPHHFGGEGACEGV